MIKLTKSNKPGRNEQCPCGSGLKFKFCHGDPLKMAICNQVANEKMVELIKETQIKKGLRCKHGVLKTKHCPTCEIGD